MGIDAGAVNVAPLAGLVIDTVGVPPPAAAVAGGCR